MALPIGIQLYTVRDHLNEDFAGTLKAIKEIGYEYVEFAGFYGNTAAEVKTIIDELGLKSNSAHIGLADLQADLDQVIADAKAIGYKHVVCPGIFGELQNKAGFESLVPSFIEWAEKLKAEGLAFGYHNHAFEYDAYEDGGCGFDTLFAGVDASLMNSELDVYWVQFGDRDPLAEMDKLAGRLPLVHMKDMKSDGSKGMTEIGTGCVPLKAIAEKAEAIGVEILVVEQDNSWNGTALESAKTSFEGLKAMIS